ncbi:MAG: hypothetical protein WKG07_04260 [Hymenobacter sp.]
MAGAAGCGSGPPRRPARGSCPAGTQLPGRGGATVAPGEHLQVYDTETGQATTVRVVADSEVPAGWRYAFI